MHNSAFIGILALALLSGGLFGLMFKRLFGLPLILGYLLAGVTLTIVQNNFFPSDAAGDASQIPQSLAEVGVLLLMFSMGLHFGIRKIKSLGAGTAIVGVVQILLMWATTTALCQHVFHYAYQEALFLGAALTTASTAVIVKVLEDFGLRRARFAERLQGVLVIEDAVAIFLIIWLSAEHTSGEGGGFLQILPLFVSCIFLWWILGTILVPRLMRYAFARGRDELLLVLSVGFAMGLAWFSSYLHFSAALGAFIMGSVFAECREVRRIESLIEPVRNLFGLVFFVGVGFLFSLEVALAKWDEVLICVAAIITFKFLYNFILNLITGAGLKDSIRISGSMGQIGELSFVIAQVGVLYQVIPQATFSFVVAVALVTMIMTPFISRTFFYLADRSGNIFPYRLVRGIDIYSKFLLDFSLKSKLKPVPLRFLGARFMAQIASLVSSLLRKNYQKFTTGNVTQTLDRLAPWDEYLVPVHVVSGSGIEGQRLIDLKLRETFNINVVAIERQTHSLVSPRPHDLVLGGDTLLVYGNEGSIAKLDALCVTAVEQEGEGSLDDCLLVSLSLEANHPFVGKSILDLGIRVNYSCIILAVTREGRKLKNPESSFVFLPADELFIFGEKESIAKIRAIAPAA